MPTMGPTFLDQRLSPAATCCDNDVNGKCCPVTSLHRCLLGAPGRRQRQRVAIAPAEESPTRTASGDDGTNRTMMSALLNQSGAVVRIDASCVGAYVMVPDLSNSEADGSLAVGACNQLVTSALKRMQALRCCC
jgi:hypothetical protein